MRNVSKSQEIWSAYLIIYVENFLNKNDNVSK